MHGQLFLGCSPGFSQHRKMIHSEDERAISCCQPHRMLAHPKDFEGKSLGGDKRRRCSVRSPDQFTAGRLLIYTESAAGKTNKHWKRRNESLRTVRWVKAPVNKDEDN